MAGAAEQDDERPPEQGFGHSLHAAARGILDDARHALAGPALSNAEAVHEVRKAFKRWRALLRLLAGPIGKPAEEMRVTARELMRTLSGARDAQAALDAIADLGKTDPALSPTSIKTMGDRLGQLRGNAESADFSPELRARLMQYLDAATAAVDQWQLTTVEFAAIADGVTVTYRRARQLVPKNWTDSEAEHLHDFRRRVVEHRHQLELIEPLWPRVTKVWAQEAQRLRERLGACQDIAVLEALIAPRQILAPWRSRLVPAIAARRAAHLDAAAKIASRLFAEKPKAFRARIGALWKAKRVAKD